MSLSMRQINPNEAAVSVDGRQVASSVSMTLFALCTTPSKRSIYYDFLSEAHTVEVLICSRAWMCCLHTC